ncbi:MAG: class I SAM-dependent methyltransferase [Planctomycetia bacterium]|nr:class I SAM-dependent methyltransferase [Planctomycetia bacterium]
MVLSAQQNRPLPAADQAAARIDSPLAPGHGAKLVRRIPVAELAQAWECNLGIDIGPFFRSIDEVLLYACNRTGVQFFRPSAAAGPAALYERLQDFPWYYAREKWEHAAALGHVAGARRVLEIGCAEGSFLDACRARGLEASGVELNPRAAAIARRQGHTVYTQPLADLRAEHAGTWDVACAFQVLEHIADPGPFLEDMLAMVRPGGVLVLAVPDRDSFIRHTHATHGVPLDTPPHHMSRWNAESFRRLAVLLGVVIESVLHEPLAADHVSYWIDVQCRRIRRSSRWAGALCGARPVRRLAALALGLGLRRLIRGQTLLVILRRT